LFYGDKKDTEVAIVIRAHLFCLCIGKILQLKEMSVIDVSPVWDNQNVLMELNRKQYHRWRCSGLQNRWGTSTVTGNDFNVAAIMEKANAIRQVQEIG
jgi:hypothetical protein